jgi:hypothetical protein
MPQCTTHTSILEIVSDRAQTNYLWAQSAVSRKCWVEPHRHQPSELWAALRYCMPEGPWNSCHALSGATLHFGVKNPCFERLKNYIRSTTVNFLYFFVVFLRIPAHGSHAFSVSYVSLCTLSVHRILYQMRFRKHTHLGSQNRIFGILT